ncbi:hypothetical protein ACQ4PT_044512 [Festuca glaucescens]
MAAAGEEPPGALSGEQPPLPLMILLYLRCDTLVALAALAVVRSGIAFGFVKGGKACITAEKSRLLTPSVVFHFLLQIRVAVWDVAVLPRTLEVRMLGSSIEQTEQKKEVIVILDSDDEDESTAGYQQLTPENEEKVTPEKKQELTPEKSKQLIQSEWTDGNAETVPRKRKNEANPAVLDFPSETHSPVERKQQKSDLSSQVDGDAETVPRKRRNEANAAVLDLPSETYSPVERKLQKLHLSSQVQVDGDAEILPRKNEANPAVLDLPSETYSPVEEDAPMEEEDKPERESDGLEDFWNDFSLAIESSKLDTLEEVASEKKVTKKEVDTDCNHDIRIHEDLGHVCRVCGMIVRRADTIIDYQWKKSFLAKYPSARPLVILPKGILGTWKREFQRWQVEDIPLYDFYSVKADKRADQLEILNSWQAKMSILFLGYTQFSQIICSDGGGTVAAACRDMLLMVPNLLIMDEGHTPRNRETNVLESLSRVQTPRKVVLSGTLFQNHVREVFNILNLVRPQFLKMERSRPIVRRIMCQVAMSGSRISKAVADNVFTESVEETLLNDDNFVRKAHVIRSLRELTKDVLHYYKGDILEELPGLVDFSVFLKLSPKQKQIVHKLEAYEKFKGSAVGAALYMHPCLSEISEVAAADRAINSTDATIDSLVQSINVTDGVKARFFTNILVLANSAGEKVLAFGQYILPMKFLERLLVKTKGWHVGKEIFVISGDTSPEERDLAMEQFNNSADAKVLFGSIKACGEGISLVGASRVVILDVHLNPSVTRQAIGRAFRPGQHKKVFVYRLVAADSLEENFHETAFKKEVIPKLWFEWSEQHCTSEEGFKLNNVDIDNCEDELLDNKTMRQDIKALYRRVLQLPHYGEMPGLRLQ